MAIKINNTTVINDSRSLENITGGAILGIQSAGTVVGSGATILNFIGAGNTFSYNAGTKTLNISIQGSGGGSGGGIGATAGIVTYSVYSNPSTLSAGNYSLSRQDSEGGTNYAVFGPFTIPTGATVTVANDNYFVVI